MQFKGYYPVNFRDKLCILSLYYHFGKTLLTPVIVRKTFCVPLWATQTFCPPPLHFAQPSPTKVFLNTPLELTPKRNHTSVSIVRSVFQHSLAWMFTSGLTPKRNHISVCDLSLSERLYGVIYQMSHEDSYKDETEPVWIQHSSSVVIRFKYKRYAVVSLINILRNRHNRCLSYFSLLCVHKGALGPNHLFKYFPVEFWYETCTISTYEGGSKSPCNHLFSLHMGAFIQRWQCLHQVWTFVFHAM